MMPAAASRRSGEIVVQAPIMEMPMPVSPLAVAPERFSQTHDEFRRLRAVTFPIFLVAAVVRRAMPHRRRVNAYMSIIHEAKAMADCALPFAYMG